LGNNPPAAAFLGVTTGMSARQATAVSDPAQPVAISDETLVARLCSGESAAGDELVRRHCEGLLRYLTRLCGKMALAEELHQQTWLSVLEHVDRFDRNSGVGGFRAWLYRIATNKVHDHWRSTGRRKLVLEQVGRMVEEAGPDASARLSGSEEAEKLRRAVEELPDAQREVVCMRYYGNLKFVQIAEALGCPLNTALGRMHKAVVKLRKLMDDEAAEQRGGES
jgi:RNA polymerase sigma-70 factor (ECF subfamily)